MTKILVADLKPNPFRNMRNYPIQPEKIKALVRSIRDTTFWDNVLVRKAPNGAGGYELAYGHHRLAALKKTDIETIDVPVRDLDDTRMAQIMAHENMEEWGTSASVEQETVRAIIEGYAAGRINLPSPDGRKDQYRNAPSFLMGDLVRTSEASHPYTIESLTRFLGWETYKVQSAINSLALIEQGVAKPDQFTDLTPRQAQAVSEHGARVLKQTKNKKTASSVVQSLSSGFSKASGGKGKTKKAKGGVRDVTIHSARRVADEVAGTKPKKPKKLPKFDKFVESIAGGVGWYFENKKAQWAAVIQFKDEMPADLKRKLIGNLKGLIREAQKMIDKLEA